MPINIHCIVTVNRSHVDIFTIDGGPEVDL